MMLMNNARRVSLAAFAAASLFAGLGISAPARAAGDLLVAPTRVVLDGSRGAEVILNNIGAEEATYRITLELRRMNELGRLDDVDKANANDSEKAALSVLSFGPKSVKLPPNQPQSIRIGLHGVDALPDGEYRAHMMFRAIPKTPPAAENDSSQGMQIRLYPVYGIAIPIIIRKGKLEAMASIANPQIVVSKDGPILEFDLNRKGNRSVYGDFTISKPGISEPLLMANGIAVYPERDSRKVTLALSPEMVAKMHGPLTITYREASDAGGATMAQITTNIP